MKHIPRFETGTLSKEYPLPETVPEEASIVFVREQTVGILPGTQPSVLFPRAAVSPFPDDGDLQYLGSRGSVPCYAADAGNDMLLPAGITFSGVRELNGTIPDDELAIAGLAVHITEYHRATRFCGRCGTKTVPSRSERAKVCPACQYTTYARISPAIIVLVRNGKRILLLHPGGAPAGRYTLVAGFVEPGETIEHAVHREVMEETGIAITNLNYIASEPWPFPNSLMIGFVADYARGEIRPDGMEIESAGWFDRYNLPAFPPKLSIAHTLLEGWLTGEFS